LNHEKPRKTGLKVVCVSDVKVVFLFKNNEKSKYFKILLCQKIFTLILMLQTNLILFVIIKYYFRLPLA